MKRTEWLNVDDVISTDPRTSNLYKVLEVKPERNGILVQNISQEDLRQILFISDANTEEYYKIRNVPGEHQNYGQDSNRL